jgi:D-sedoheptulose 7-phosphate isomerase
MTAEANLAAYSRTLDDLIRSSVVTDAAGQPVPLEAAATRVGRQLREVNGAGKRIYIIGNGGSAGIASHLAVDFSKNGGMRTSALNDSSALTCLGNDFGYEFVFSKQLEWYAQPGDALIAISSSGRSKNVLNGVAVGREKNCDIFTFSGFDKNNPLRRKGDVNFFVASDLYGFVEVAHLALLHGILDIQMGWRPAVQFSPV